MSIDINKIVEDNLVNQSLLKRLLSKQGCICSVANHGQEAIDMIRSTLYADPDGSRRYDCVLMDIEASTRASLYVQPRLLLLCRCRCSEAWQQYAYFAKCKRTKRFRVMFRSSRARRTQETSRSRQWRQLDLTAL